MNSSFWKGREILITGHTGFKGSWLSAFLHELGAHVHGISLSPISDPNMFDLLGVSTVATSNIFDINDQDKLAQTLKTSSPQIVFHLAAQSLVRRSYEVPIETFMTNVVGTVSLLNVLRAVPSVEAIIIVTSDKCYQNEERVRGYRETDRLGGRDPYSASKSCVEIATQSMQKSYFAPYSTDGHSARIATVRAGNVIGGGDWSQDRLIPDIVRGCLGPIGEVHLRYPDAVRPWQHVLEPLRGYLSLAERLVLNPDGMDGAWNFGPSSEGDQAVLKVAQSMVTIIGAGRIVVADDRPHLKEDQFLRLDCGKAKSALGWVPVLTFEGAIRMTAEWYLEWLNKGNMMTFTTTQIHNFMQQL